MWLSPVLAVIFWKAGHLGAGDRGQGRGEGGGGTAEPHGRLEGLCNYRLMKDAGSSTVNARDRWEANALGMS